VTIHPFIELTRRMEMALVDRIVRDGALYFPTPDELRAHALSQATLESGLVLEFGVFDGSSIRQIAALSRGIVHGFDSFQGLPRGDGIEVWERHVAKATFDRSGQLPEVPENVRLYAGLFEDTLPAFLDEESAPVAFVHVDCDIYSSSKVVLELLAERIVAGTIIVFDDFFNYPGWQFGEYKAFEEFVRAHGVRYTILGVATRGPNDHLFGHYGRISLRVEEMNHRSPIR
jgi:hypothetical protein